MGWKFFVKSKYNAITQYCWKCHQTVPKDCRNKVEKKSNRKINIRKTQQSLTRVYNYHICERVCLYCQQKFRCGRVKADSRPKRPATWQAEPEVVNIIVDVIRRWFAAGVTVGAWKWCGLISTDALPEAATTAISRFVLDVVSTHSNWCMYIRHCGLLIVS